MPEPRTPRPTPALAIRDLRVTFPAGNTTGRTVALADASLTVYPGQCVAVVGESGSGKSVTALSVLRLLPEDTARYERGSILLHRPGDAAPIDVLALAPRDLRTVRGRTAAMIFQEPMTSLNPVVTIGDQVAEAFGLHGALRGRAALRAAAKALEDAGIADAANRLRAYPHELSGGMRQRVVIAIALACGPAVLLADEPTTALDAATRGGVLALLDRARATRGMGVVLITHDLPLAASVAQVVCVMHAGRVVEYGPAPRVFAQPFHPYTAALRACVPRVGDRAGELTTVASITEHPGVFEKLCAPVRKLAPSVVPWWPGMPPPADLRAGAEPVLARIAEDRWVSLWPTEQSRVFAADPPDIAP